MKTRGLLIAILGLTGATSLAEVSPQSPQLRGEYCRLISTYTNKELQDLIGDALEQASRERKEVSLKIPRKFGLEEYRPDLGALSLLYTVSNIKGLIVMISPEEIVVTPENEKQVA